MHKCKLCHPLLTLMSLQLMNASQACVKVVNLTNMIALCEKQTHCYSLIIVLLQ